MTYEVKVHEDASEKPVRPLNIRGPVWIGVLIVLAFFGLGVGAAAISSTYKSSRMS